MAIGLMSAAATVCESSGWKISNLEVQKLLYLSHMKFLGLHAGKPLVSKRFEAWKYGPVVPELYHKLKVFGNRAVGDIFLVSRNLELPEHQLIRDVVEHFSNRTSGELVEITHATDGAWDRYYEPGTQGVIIPNAAILEEYVEEPF